METILRETYLSQKPRAGARNVMATSVLIVTAVTVANWANWGGIAPYLLATPGAVLERLEWWRLFTSCLIHSDGQHLTGNLFALGWLTYVMYGYYGGFIYPWLAWAGGAATNAIVLSLKGSGGGILGASGAIYWMAGFWVVLYLYIDRRYGWGGRLLRGVGFSLAVFAPTSFDPHVSYLSHAVGFGLGGVIGAVYFVTHKATIRAAERVEVELDT